MQWFRFYSEALDDPKVQRLPGDLFKAWVNLLCLANEQDERGTLPDLLDITFRLRLDDQKAEDAVSGLVRAGLLEYDEDGNLCVHSWDKRQYKSDLDVTATERKKRQREREKAVTRDVTRDISVTSRSMSRDVTRTDTDTEKIQKQKQNKGEGTGRATRATPAPDDFPLTDSMLEWAADHAPDVDVVRETERFLDRNRAQGTTYKDWHAAWRNWLTSPYAKAPARPTSRAPDLHAVNGVAMSPRMARNLRVLQETEL